MQSRAGPSPAPGGHQVTSSITTLHSGHAGHHQPYIGKYIEDEFGSLRSFYSHVALVPCILSTLGHEEVSSFAPIIPTVHHIHVPVHICHPGFWANPSKMKSFVDVARHFLCFRPIHKLLSGAKCKSTPGARSRSPGEGADGTSLMQILSREI